MEITRKKAVSAIRSSVFFFFPNIIIIIIPFSIADRRQICCHYRYGDRQNGFFFFAVATQKCTYNIIILTLLYLTTCVYIVVFR